MKRRSNDFDEEEEKDIVLPVNVPFKIEPIIKEPIKENLKSNIQKKAESFSKSPKN